MRQGGQKAGDGQYPHIKSKYLFIWSVSAYKVPLFRISRVRDDEVKKKIAYTWEMQEQFERILIDEVRDSRPQDRNQKINLLRLFMMATETGMRQGEVRNIPLRNIDFNERLLLIRFVPETGW
ncbi:MAG: hypothetical protein HQ517_10780 [SAR324 cluster bacterium]|nr:hypothetical protein [SAR324 cluster bacterium]